MMVIDTCSSILRGVNMKRFVILVCLVAAIGVIALVVQSMRSKPPSEKEWPIKGIRRAVKDIAPSDVRAVMFPQLMENRRGIRDITVTDPKLIEAFISGLKKAAYPCDPEMLPGNRMYAVKLILKDGRTIGPFYFGVDGPKHAFSREFATALNEVVPGLVRRM